MKWAFKIIAKLILARLPIPYAFWKSIGIFRHGRMDTAEYPIKIFKLHTTRAFPAGMPSGLVMLELGPGDSIASALLAAASGAERIYLVDVGNFASRDIALYQSLANDMRTRGINVPDISSAKNLEDILQSCRAVYLTQGLMSLRTIPSNSLDFVWSHSVLEHVRKHEFVEVLQELKRIAKKGSKASHNIDFQDHLDGALNNLRFSESVWESDFFTKSGFYTNRIPAVTMHDMFKQAGYLIEEQDFGKWPALPIPRRCIHSSFADYKNEDLIVRTSHVLLQV